MSTEVTETPIAWKHVEDAMRLSERRFETGDVDGLVAKYADDVVIRFSGLPEIRGRKAARRWLAARIERQQNYRLTKKILAIDGQKVVRSWTGTWVDSRTKKKMEGRELELIEMREGKVVLWDACFNVWEEGKALESEYFEPG
jgi:nuclear transport factor 2 (NTF2) superfamily protein